MRTSSIDERRHDRTASRRSNRWYFPADAAGCRDDGRSGGDRPRYRADELARAVAPRPAGLRALRRSAGPAGPSARAWRARADRNRSPARRRRRQHLPTGCPSCRCRCPDRAASGDAAIVAAIEMATAAVMAGEALALVTNPITKRTLNLAHLPYPGHTEFLAELAARHGGGSRPRPVMMLVAEELKVVPATVHIPLTAVAKALTRPLLLETIRITAAALDPRLRHRAPAHCGDRAQSARRRRRPHRSRGDRRDRSRHSRACRRGSGGDGSACGRYPVPRRGAPHL